MLPRLVIIKTNVFLNLKLILCANSPYLFYNAEPDVYI